MATNELLPFANGEDANVLSIAEWQALTDILQNGFQSGIARSEQVNRVLAQGAVASYVLGQLIVDQLAQDATLDETTLYQNLVLALQENAKDVCLPFGGGNLTGNLTVQGKNVVLSLNGLYADASGNVTISIGAVSQKINTTISGKNATVTISNLTPNKPLYVVAKCVSAGNYATRFYVNSGVALNATISPANGFSGTQGDGSTCWLVMVPTETSVSIVAENTVTSVNHSVIAYQ